MKRRLTPLSRSTRPLAPSASRSSQRLDSGGPAHPRRTSPRPPTGPPRRRTFSFRAATATADNVSRARTTPRLNALVAIETGDSAYARSAAPRCQLSVACFYSQHMRVRVRVQACLRRLLLSSVRPKGLPGRTGPGSPKTVPCRSSGRWLRSMCLNLRPSPDSVCFPA